MICVVPETPARLSNNKLEMPLQGQGFAPPGFLCLWHRSCTDPGLISWISDRQATSARPDAMGLIWAYPGHIVSDSSKEGQLENFRVTHDGHG